MTRSNPHAGEPISDSAAIAAALEDVSIPTLVLSLAHVTGDPSWFRGEIRPQARTTTRARRRSSRRSSGRTRRSSTRGNKNADGKIHILSPWRLVDYWAWTKRPDPNDFTIS